LFVEKDNIEINMELIFKEEFYLIKQACITVRKILGNGFLEKVYENALLIELKRLGLSVVSQKELLVKYRGQTIGQYFADIVINDKIIIELKTAKKIENIHKMQVLNYLKATGYELGVLINFPNDSAGFDIERIPNFIENR
jgi:GxxExxY protein